MQQNLRVTSADRERLIQTVAGAFYSDKQSKWTVSNEDYL